MKPILISLLFLLPFAATQAQTAHPEAFISRLSSPDASSGSRVTVSMSDSLDRMLNRPESYGNKTVDGYRVYIFRDNTQYGREKAQSTRARFRTEFPDIRGDTLIYQSPDWMVAVGHCLTREEAAIILGRIKGVFDAWVRQEKIPLRSFLQATFQPVAGPEEQEQAAPADTTTE
jgi:hypothetical protein